jgi:hypothetical protein
MANRTKLWGINIVSTDFSKRSFIQTHVFDDKALWEKALDSLELEDHEDTETFETYLNE